MKPTTSLFVLCGLFCGNAFSSDDNWPQFRGPGARGIAERANPPDRWSTTENVAWKTDIPGRGWSSPIVWGNKLFLTSVINQGITEPAKKGLYFGGERLTPPKTEHQWKVFCLDLNSGKINWEKTVKKGPPPTSIHIKNSFASETPVTDGERVYCVFGNIGLFAFDLDGKELWSRPLEPRPTRFGWGPAASPVIHGDRIYFVNDNDKQSELLALDKRTGKEIWCVPRDEKSNWATPFVWENDKRMEIITPGSGRVASYDLDGKLLWSLRGMSSITIATPYEANGLLYISSGYVMDKSRPLYAIRPGAKGDISLKAGETTNSHIAWSHPTAAPYNPGTVTYEGRLYVLHDRGLVSCYDAKTGEMRYERERLPKGLAFTSSPWAANGKIFCLNEDGICFVLLAGDKFKLLHTNQLDGEMCMATPALAGNRLLLRTANRIYCVQLKSSKG